MCKALRELLKDEIDKEIKTAVDAAVEKAEAKADAAEAKADAAEAENARLRKYILDLGLNPNVVAEAQAPYGK